MKSERQEVLIADIIRDPGLSLRDRIYETTVSEYAEAIRAGEALPEPVIFRDATGKRVPPEVLAERAQVRFVSGGGAS